MGYRIFPVQSSLYTWELVLDMVTDTKKPHYSKYSVCMVCGDDDGWTRRMQPEELHGSRHVSLFTLYFGRVPFMGGSNRTSGAVLERCPSTVGSKQGDTA